MASSGQTLDFGASELEAAASAYDPSLSEAPIVIGHPSHDAPAYGWVRGLEFADPDLTAEPDQVDPAFADMVRRGRFKKISASFYRPDAPSNPRPGVYYLRHVGFLGAQPPAVKGLRQAEFDEIDAVGETVTVEFGDPEDSIAAGLWRSLRDWFIGRFGQDEADKALPGDAINGLQTLAAQPEPREDRQAAAAAFAENTPQEASVDLEKEREQIAAEREKVEREKAEFAERQERLARQEAEARNRANADFVDGLVAAGKILPRDRDNLVAFMAELGVTVVEFADAEGKKQERAVAEWFREFLEGQPKRVDFEERAGGAGEEPGPAVDFPVPQGASVEPERLQQHRRILAYAEQHKVDYVTAAHAVGE
ncbi:MAG TPA: peptidase [Gammaproteobacteria bacterium]|nr:peptidase [Gammaproteobacteria bacterium]